MSGECYADLRRPNEQTPDLTPPQALRLFDAIRAMRSCAQQPSGSPCNSCWETVCYAAGLDPHPTAAELEAGL